MAARFGSVYAIVGASQGVRDGSFGFFFLNFPALELTGAQLMKS